MNYRVIFNVLGWVLNIEAVCLLLPLICAVVYSEPEWQAFAICIVLCLFVGALLSFKLPKNKSIYAREGFVIVALSWIVMSILGSLPFILSGSIRSFHMAFFETVSGFTTTGASVIADVEALPKSILMWRSFTHWIGGMGVLVFLVALLPLSGGNNMHLIKAESPGPAVSKLVPKVRSTAKILYTLYIVLTVLEIVFLLFGKMSLFDAITTAFGTAGTGGFGIKNASIGEYSPYIQNVVTVFMIIFGVDFSFYYLLAVMHDFKSAFKMEEVRAYFIIIAVAIGLICINSADRFLNIAENIRHSAFQVASVITTTGYSTTDFNTWPEFSKMILLLLMFFGACAGSTGGGIKVSRIIILAKSLVKEIKIAAHPRTVHKITLNKKPIEHETVRSVNTFMVAYVIIYAVSVLLISFDNLDFTTNFTAVLATLNNIGPGLSKVGPTENFSIFSPFSTLVLTFDMLVGRLEIFPMLVLFSPYAWKK